MTMEKGEQFDFIYRHGVRYTIFQIAFLSIVTAPIFLFDMSHLFFLVSTPLGIIMPIILADTILCNYFYLHGTAVLSDDYLKINTVHREYSIFYKDIKKACYASAVTVPARRGPRGLQILTGFTGHFLIEGNDNGDSLKKILKALEDKLNANQALKVNLG